MYDFSFSQEVYLNRKLDDTVLLQRILALCLPSLGALQPVRLSANQGPGFVIQHYAGPVVYSVCDLIAKNKVVTDDCFTGC